MRHDDIRKQNQSKGKLKSSIKKQLVEMVDMREMAIIENLSFFSLKIGRRTLNIH